MKWLRIIFYQGAHAIVFIVVKIIFRMRIIGYSKVPKKGGVIIAANHVSYLDPPLIACSILRRVNFMAMAGLFKNPFCRILYTLLGAFPVKRGEPDTWAIRHAVRLLKNGEVLLMFPEGTRSYDGKLQEFKAGVGMIAALSRASVVPAFIRGTDIALPRGSWRLRPSKVILYFGDTVDFSESSALGESSCPATLELKGEKDEYSDKRKRLYNDMNMKIMQEIAKMQAKAMNNKC